MKMQYYPKFFLIYSKSFSKAMKKKRIIFSSEFMNVSLDKFFAPSPQNNKEHINLYWNEPSLSDLTSFSVLILVSLISLFLKKVRLLLPFSLPNALFNISLFFAIRDKGTSLIQ